MWGREKIVGRTVAHCAEALGLCLVLLFAVSGFATWFHPELFGNALPVRTVLTVLTVYPTVFVGALLLAGPEAIARWWGVVKPVGVAGAVTGPVCLLAYVLMPARVPLLTASLLLQIVCVPWLLPRAGRHTLVLLSIFFRAGVLLILVGWAGASYMFSTHIQKRAEALAAGRQYCLSAPMSSDIYGSTALPSSSDWLLLQRVISYPVNLYYGRHRLELSIFDGHSHSKTYHWSIKNGDFEPGGLLTPIDDCRKVLRSQRPATGQ